MDEIKKNLVQNTKISKKRQFGNEILGLFKYNPRIMNNINNNQNGIDMNSSARSPRPLLWATGPTSLSN